MMPPPIIATERRVEVPVLVPYIEGPAAPKAHYEGAWPTPERARLLTTRLDADEDSAWFREAIAESARYLDRNSCLMAGITERMRTFAVGNGVNPEPITSDKFFNRDAEAAWEGSRDKLDLETDFSWDDIVSVIYGTTLVEGGIYGVNTYDAGEPKIQLIDFHRMAGKDRNSGGIEYDSNGKPKSYRCLLGRDRTGPATTIEAEYVVPHFFPSRPRQHYGVSIFAPAILTVQDIHEILRFEKAAVKYTSSIIEVIENETGEAPSGSLVQQLRQAQQKSSDGKENADEQRAWYQKVFGAAIRFVKKGHKYQQYSPQRPSPTWAGMMEFLSATVCMPTGMPPSTLLPIKVGGVDTRKDLATAARVIERHQRRLAFQLQRYYEHVIDWHLGSAKNKPKDWRATEWQYPRSITADAGRQGQQDREDIGMGTGTLRVYCGENGLGGLRGYLRRRSQEITERDIACFEENERRAKLNIGLPPLRPEQLFNYDYKSQPGAPIATEQPQPEPANA